MKSIVLSIFLLLGAINLQAEPLCKQLFTPNRFKIIEVVDQLQNLKERMSKLPSDKAHFIELTEKDKEIYLEPADQYFKEANGLLKPLQEKLTGSVDEIKPLIDLAKDIEAKFEIQMKKKAKVTLKESFEQLIKSLLLREKMVELEEALDNPALLAERLKALKTWKMNDYLEEGMFEVFKYYDRVGFLPVPIRGSFGIAEFNKLLGKKIAPLSFSIKKQFVDGIQYTPYYLFFHDVNHIGGYKKLVDHNFWQHLVNFIESLPQVEKEAAHAILFRDSHETNLTISSGAFAIPEFGIVRDDQNAKVQLMGLQQRLANEKFWGFKTLENNPDLNNLLVSVGKKMGDVVEKYLAEKK